jgi:hypothetical protein
VQTSRLLFVRERRREDAGGAFLAVVVVGLLSLATFARCCSFAATPAVRPLAEEVRGRHPELARPAPAWLVHSLPTDADGLQEQHRRVAEGAPRRRADVRPGRNADPVRISSAWSSARSSPCARPIRRATTARSAQALANRAVRFGEAFGSSSSPRSGSPRLNAALTAFYLAIVLPLSRHSAAARQDDDRGDLRRRPDPVFGNLISNVVVVVVSLSVSPYRRARLARLPVVIHKLEYFLNAGSSARRSSAAWELLLAMLVMEGSVRSRRL